MQHTILPNGNLRITATDDERAELRALRDDEGGTIGAQGERDALERLVCNSELQWIPEGATADITDAPMLGIVAAQEHHEYHAPTFNRTDRLDWCGPIMARWAFMDYQVRSFVDDLIEHGESTWQGGFAEEPWVPAYRKAQHRCPVCQSEDLNADSMSHDGEEITQEVVCCACEASWTDVYRFATAHSLQKPSQPQPQTARPDCVI